MSITPQYRERIDAIALINADDGSHVKYEGPFPIIRDGAYVEVVIPTDETPGVHHDVAERIVESPHGLAALMVHGELDITGTVDTIDMIEGELIIRINDGDYVQLAELDEEQIPEVIKR